MSKSLAEWALGVFSAAILALNTIFWCLLLFVVAVLKFIIPAPGWRNMCTKLSNEIAECWVGINSLGLDLTKDIQWDVEGLSGLRRDAWYLLVANHQSMVDITVLQKIFHRKVPLLKFFLKKELIYVPILGMAWWALDFPFMKRTSSARKDLETTRKACEKFKQVPVTIMNFMEGTRFTEEKREEQNAPYAHLLKPKAGGVAVVLGCMGEQLNSVLDVTIVYPEGAPGMWDFLCSRTLEVKVRIKQIPLTEALLGNYFKDRPYRQQFNSWLNKLWEDKDKLIDTLLSQSPGQSSEREGVGA